MNDVPIRDAASVILLRDATTNPRVLMGQRGKNAAFMPSKYVFPGGAVDPADGKVDLATTPDSATMQRLALQSPKGFERAIIASAIREVWEETGLIFGTPSAPISDAPEGWAGFFASGNSPAAAGFHYIFRAVTPPRRPRRFDARFFLVDADQALGDLDDFSTAQDELSHLHWVHIDEARNLNLPFITEVVLAEVAALAQSGQPPASVPFFNNTQDVSEFLRLV
ncbi:NUDIX hydrolase [Litoreibacter sp.]|nr:NUDIX hydrolase [Litoreibacter sp.]